LIRKPGTSAPLPGAGKGKLDSRPVAADDPKGGAVVIPVWYKWHNFWFHARIPGVRQYEVELEID
jgi:hypothetical protein